MSAVGDAFTALKNVVLLQDRMERLEKQVGSMVADLDGLKTFTHDLDKRLYALERIIDLGARQSQQRRIEE